MLIYLLVSFVWWQWLSITVVTSGYHRYFAHKSFHAPVWYEVYVLSLGSLTGSGPLLGWAGIHRMHHRHTETEKDPHSPRFVGMWKVLTSTFKAPHIDRRYIRDLMRNKRVMFFFKHHDTIQTWLFIAFLIFAVAISWQWALVFFVSPMIYSYIGFGLINAFAHDADGAKNSQLINILAAGDGFHKNHHDKPSDWKIGKQWHEFDPGAIFIRMIKND